MSPQSTQIICMLHYKEIPGASQLREWGKFFN